MIMMIDDMSTTVTMNMHFMPWLRQHYRVNDYSDHTCESPDRPVHVPGLNARARIEMTFAAPAGSDRRDWAEIACERTRMTLDPS